MNPEQDGWERVEPPEGANQVEPHLLSGELGNLVYEIGRNR